jgi:hypothetical protein
MKPKNDSHFASSVEELDQASKAPGRGSDGRHPPERGISLMEGVAIVVLVIALALLLFRSV